MKGRHTPEQIVAKLRQAELELAGAGPNSTKLEFGYDYLSRRVERRDYAYTDGQWVLGEHHRFVYDGWNVIEELDAMQGGGQPPVIRKYTWGLDLAGQNGAPSASGMTPQGAGGIGGLVACYDTGGGTTSTSDDRTFLYFYDANGNVGQLIETTGGPGGVNPETPPLPSYGMLAAHYEYDPYGGRLNSPAGEYAQPYRFSTKRLDPDTALLYYGHRDLNTRLGRWTNRDPIGERGGSALYQFVFNRSTLTNDALGLLCEGPPLTIGIDGTAFTEYGSVRDETPPSNVYYFCKDAHPLGDPVGDTYFRGVGTEPSRLSFTFGQYYGAGTESRVGAAKSRICRSVCDPCPPRQINIVGWSRGAIAALMVADRLNSRGCCCKWAQMRVWERDFLLGEVIRTRLECCDRRTPRINFLGLYDPVDMRPDIVHGVPARVPANVRACAIVVAGKFELLFPKQDFETDDRTSLIYLEANHGGAGTERAADEEMRRCACKYGVALKERTEYPPNPPPPPPPPPAPVREPRRLGQRIDW